MGRGEGEIYSHSCKTGRLNYDPILQPCIYVVQPADIGWPTGNGKKLSSSQACCLAQLCLAAGIGMAGIWKWQGYYGVYTVVFTCGTEAVPHV